MDLIFPGDTSSNNWGYLKKLQKIIIEGWGRGGEGRWSSQLNGGGVVGIDTSSSASDEFLEKQ